MTRETVFKCACWILGRNPQVMSKCSSGVQSEAVAKAIGVLAFLILFNFMVFTATANFLHPLLAIPGSLLLTVLAHRLEVNLFAPSPIDRGGLGGGLVAIRVLVTLALTILATVHFTPFIYQHDFTEYMHTQNAGVIAQLNAPAKKAREIAQDRVTRLRGRVTELDKSLADCRSKLPPLEEREAALKSSLHEHKTNMANQEFGIGTIAGKGPKYRHSEAIAIQLEDEIAALTGQIIAIKRQAESIANDVVTSRQQLQEAESVLEQRIKDEQATNLKADEVSERASTGSKVRFIHHQAREDPYQFAVLIAVIVALAFYETAVLNLISSRGGEYTQRLRLEHMVTIDHMKLALCKEAAKPPYDVSGKWSI